MHCEIPRSVLNAIEYQVNDHITDMPHRLRDVDM